MCVTMAVEGAWSRHLRGVSTEVPQPKLINNSFDSPYILAASDSSEFYDSDSSSVETVDSARAAYIPAKPLAHRPVHRLSPLETFSDVRILAFAKPFQQLPAQEFAKPPPLADGPAYLQERSGSSSGPVAIPGAKKQEPLERQPSLIKAVPRPSPFETKPFLPIDLPKRSGSPKYVAPEGSWTKRQVRFPVNEPEQQPPGLSRALKARNTAVKSRAAKQSTSITAKSTAQELAWRFRFKKKWIREELFARKMDFPDDPGYLDEWAAAEELIEACGPMAALQAAFLESSTKAGDVSFEDEFALDSADSLLFEDSDDDSVTPSEGGASTHSRSSSGSEVAAKAATLVRLTSRNTRVA